MTFFGLILGLIMKARGGKRNVFVAVPAMDEEAYLPALIGCLQNQSIARFKLIVCVNQPDSWWDDPEKVSVSNFVGHKFHDEIVRNVVKE